MIVYICLGDIRRDQRHVVKRSHQDAAIEGEEVHVAIQVSIVGGSDAETAVQAARKRCQATATGSARAGGSSAPGRLSGNITRGNEALCMATFKMINGQTPINAARR
mgnify:CR=1 FL=1